MKKVKIIFVFALFSLFSCESRNEKIKSYWKYIEGYHFGDFLNMKDGKWDISSDTIYNNWVPVAVVKEYRTGYFGSENKLLLKHIDSGKLGLYTDKAN